MVKRLQTAQNKIIRFIRNMESRTHISEQVFIDLNLLNIHNRAKQLRLSHVFNIFNETCPDYLQSNFTKVSAIHQYNTRNRAAQNFQVHKSTTISSGSFYHNAIQDWANLPSAIKSIPKKDRFKKAVKTHLLNQVSC
jgi:hypothetical protein